ncbi:hypothetical protein [Actinomadura sp. 21ATH]|uniref:hypothetical protein n=1 Tax=Actinomadura sp. 21ATH TaxID=1735444 RepID=UPI0035C23E35
MSHSAPAGRARGPPDRGAGQGRFAVTGGGCEKTYSFSVAVRYRDPDGRNAEKASVPSAPVRPCTVPGTPAGFAARPKNKGATLTWTGSGADVTYMLSVDGGAPTPVTSPHSVTGLRNARKHRFELTARNAAGTAPAKAAAEVDLAYPTRKIDNQNNGETNTLIRAAPTRNSPQTGRIPQNEIISMTVVCQVRSENYRDGESGTSSDIWNRVRTRYGDGYLNDTLVATTKGPYPSNGLYECEM